MKLSIITATFNAAHTVSDSLESVARQHYREFEHWVVDGGSRDGTQAVVERHRDRLAGFISEPDKGIYDALNKGVARATGDVIGFLHADDIFANDDVLTKIAAAFSDPMVDAVYGDLNYVDKRNVTRVIRYWKAGDFDAARLTRGWMPPHPTFYVRRSVYERLGAFNLKYRISADYDAMMRFLFLGKIRAAYIPEVLVLMRVGGASNRSARAITRKTLEDLQIIRSHGLGGFPTLIAKNLSKLGQFRLRIA